MALKTFKPYTKSTRGTILTSREGLWKGKPYKPLTSANYSSKGRNNYGRITSRNHGGGHKHKYRKIDFYRKKNDMMAIVERIEYDPNRSCHIMLVKFDDNQKFYYLAPQKIKVGDHVQNGASSEIKIGNCLPLQDIPVGIDIHNVEIQPGAGGKIARAAGSSVTISGFRASKAFMTCAVMSSVRVRLKLPLYDFARPVRTLSMITTSFIISLHYFCACIVFSSCSSLI